MKAERHLVHCSCLGLNTGTHSFDEAKGGAMAKSIHLYEPLITNSSFKIQSKCAVRLHAALPLGSGLYPGPSTLRATRAVLCGNSPD